MQKNMGQIRLYIPTHLEVGQQISLEEKQSHYLLHVMKLTVGDTINCFDNQSGEYCCEIYKAGKKQIEIKVLSQNKPFSPVPDVWLLFAPVKKDNTDFIIQKATELGVKKIIPVITKHTISERVKVERFEMQAIEASEQCRRTDIPEISAPVKFDDIIAKWDATRKLYYMDETLNGITVAQAFQTANEPCAIIVGPEGGFSEKELQTLNQKDFTVGVSLGKRILRAETAVVASLSCWQALSGDWK